MALTNDDFNQIQAMIDFSLGSVVANLQGNIDALSGRITGIETDMTNLQGSINTLTTLTNNMSNALYGPNGVVNTVSALQTKIDKFKLTSTTFAESKHIVVSD